jgi:hypothetical protein
MCGQVCDVIVYFAEWSSLQIFKAFGDVIMVGDDENSRIFIRGTN